MRKDTYISAMNKIKASEACKEKMAEAMIHSKAGYSRKRVTYKPLAVAAVSLALVIGVSFLSLNNSPTVPIPPSLSDTQTDGVYLPAPTLPDEANIQYDMIGLIVYKGKIYTQSATHIDLTAASALQGEKLGVTKNTIDEWSTQDDYAEEFASTIGITDVYSVKGYDTEFRIMALVGDRAVIFENLNDLTVYSGEDVFQKIFNGQDLISLEYLSRYDHSVVYPIEDEALLHSFVTALIDGKPISYQELWAAYQYTDENIRDIQVELNNGLFVRLLLIEGSYVMYSNAGVLFKVDDNIFNQLWSQLDRSKDYLLQQTQ